MRDMKKVCFTEVINRCIKSGAISNKEIILALARGEQHDLGLVSAIYRLKPEWLNELVALDDVFGFYSCLTDGLSALAAAIIGGDERMISLLIRLGASTDNVVEHIVQFDVDDPYKETTFRNVSAEELKALFERKNNC